ncbi:MAG: tetraacyldisaccharide 4'-kinase [Planctomycetota bacterium]|nr:tetraacyldisaccharide 4'-kinase [Planctomycetota bacterium]
MTGPLPDWLVPASAPASIVYGAISDAVLACRARRVHAMPLPTASVGNLSVGGTGKSPLVRWIATQLVRCGASPVIVTRGYRRGRAEAADETLEHRAALPNVPVVEGVDRAAAVRNFLAGGGVANCVILDDGFQRRDVARDVDIVLVRARDFRDRRLPWGRLRESVTALRRAGVVCCPEEDGEAVAQGLRAIGVSCPVAHFARRWDGVSVWEAGRERQESTRWLSDRVMDLWLGVGDSRQFLAMAAAHGVRFGTVSDRRDHVRYTPGWVARQLAGAQPCVVKAVLTSEKDWVKVKAALEALALSAGSQPLAVVARPRLELLWPIGGDEVIRVALRRLVEGVSTVENLGMHGGTCSSA